MHEEEKELTSIFHDAVNLRRNQDAFYKRYFESLPTCVQKTLFTESSTQTRDLETCRRYLQEGQESFSKNQYFDALSKFEDACACVWFIKLRENAPHWKERGVRDEWIKVTKLDDNLAGLSLLRVCECLYEIKQWNECFSIVNHVVKLIPENAMAYFIRARCRLKMKTQDCEELAMKDLIQAKDLDPENTKIINQIIDLQAALENYREKMKKAYGGFLKKPETRFIDNQSKGQTSAKKKMNLDKIKEFDSDQEEEDFKTELDALEIEAAKEAGLDANDPIIRSLLLRLSSKKGRELFEKEEERIKKVELQNRTWKWTWMVIITGFIFAFILELYLKSITKDMIMDSMGPVQKREKIKPEDVCIDST